MSEILDQVLQFLRDSLWSSRQDIFPVAAILAAILVPVWIYRRGFRSKKLAARPLSFLVARPGVEGIEVLFKGEPIKHPVLHEITFVNTGQVPIIRDDYDRPLYIQFEEDVAALTAEVIKTSPEELQGLIEIELSEERITLSPVLLNPTNSITLRALTDGWSFDTEVGGHIAGVQQIEVGQLDPSSRPALTIAVLLIPTLIFILLGVLSICSIREIGFMIGGYLLAGLVGFVSSRLLFSFFAIGAPPSYRIHDS